MALMGRPLHTTHCEHCSPVEMAGIEPASRKFDQRSATGIVGRLASHGPGSVRQKPWLTSRFVLGRPHRRQVSRSPSLMTPAPPALGRSGRADVTDLRRPSGFRRYSLLRGDGVGRSVSVVGTYRVAPFGEVRRLGLQSVTSPPCRSLSSPATNATPSLAYSDCRGVSSADNPPQQFQIWTIHGLQSSFEMT